MYYSIHFLIFCSFFANFGALFFTNSAQAQPKTVNLENLNALIQNSQEGKTYFISKTTENTANAIYEPVGYQIKFSPARYKEYWDTIIIAPALNGNLDTTNYFTQTEILILKEPSIQWKQAQISKLCMPNAKSSTMGACMLKTTATYEIIHVRFYPYKNITDVSNTDFVIPAEIKIVKRYELVRPTQISHHPLTEKLELTLGEKIMTVTEGYWTRWAEAVCPFGASNDPQVTQIQDALLKQGYKLTKTGNFDEQTKRALLQFELDHNLPEDKLDDALWQRLGIETEKLINILD